MIEIIILTEDRFLAVVWKDGSVHFMCLATNEVAAQRIAERSLTQKPATNDVYSNIEKLVKAL